MPNQISPGIITTERDGTSVVPAVATGAAGLAGPFQWGPCDELILVDNEAELVSRFGEPKLDYNVETFYTAANFLAYANRCFAVRTAVDGQYNAISADVAATPTTNRQIQVKNDDHWG